MAVIYVNSALLVASFFFLFFATLTVLSVFRLGLVSEQLRTFVYSFMSIVIFSLIAGVTLFNGLSEDIIFRFLVFTCSLCLLLLVAALALHKCVELVADLEKESGRSVIDPLTGIYNRYYIEGRLESEVGRSKRYCSPLAVVAVEIADFHAHSVVYGFQSAERMLQNAASIITSSVRESDVVARYNENHFLVILVATPESSVRTITNRLQGNLVVGLNTQNNDATEAHKHGNVKFGNVWCNLSTATGAELICSALEQTQAAKSLVNKQHEPFKLGKTGNVKNLEQAA